MTIATLAQYASALKQRQQIQKSSLVGGAQSSLSDGWAGAGVPAPAAISPGNTANGVVPTSATTGAMKLSAFSGTGYVTAIELVEGVALSQVMLYDRLWHGGAYVNGTTTLTSQPSYSSRVPGGTDYTGLQIWAETSTSFNNGSVTITVTYTDQSGNAGATTGAITFAAPGTNVLGIATQLPLAAGDSGVQKIESVVMAITNGGMNVMVLRPLWLGSILAPSGSRLFPLEEVGMPQVWTDSCLNVMIKEATVVAGTVDMMVEIASA